MHVAALLCLISWPAPCLGFGKELRPGDAEPDVELNGVSGCSVIPGGHIIGEEIYLRNWHALLKQGAMQKLFDYAFQTAAAECVVTEVGVTVYESGNSVTPVATGTWKAATGVWDISSALPKWVQWEQRDIAAKAAAVKAQEDAQRQANIIAQRKQKALADCKPEPNYNGGPWFAPSYKVSAHDQVQKVVASQRLLCVKSVDYVSVAPNPFGGNAARIRINGYDMNGNPGSLGMDIPY
ncbi:hypothetical protein HYPDE_26868 [Hyphomicrobium denitrificans 1NES1]|uniref:Uncharacterized protein n=2 Tax=Hyphomicrobium denitrificans TaxID=53399 RepID=N0B0T1_9HYPH|nr:hypothetical protein HYPDE_26868 [Hyphomicrobium denitrificans 1NES1]